MNKKIKYQKVVTKREKILDKIQQLKENEILKKYLELTEKNTALYYEQIALYKQIKYEEYKNCKHILVQSKIKQMENTYIRRYGCIKCGLDSSVIDCKKEDILTPEQEVMYYYLVGEKKRELSGNNPYTDIRCDLELARAIYSKIVENNPGISDEVAFKYFTKALDNIRDIEVNEEREKSRAKRLSLAPNFNRWSAGAVYKSF